MKRSLVIFDGSNFYHGIKRVNRNIHLTNFRYRNLAEVLSKSKGCAVEYCVGEIRKNDSDQKSRKMYSGQQSLFYNLEKQNIVIKKGYMLKSDGVYHEKGVDVIIALDILRGALKNEYDKCYIISSDTDIIPAIIEAKKSNKIIIYVGFDGFVSRALKANCDQTILINKKYIEQFA